MFSSCSPAKIVFLDRATLSPQTVLKPFPFPHTLQTFERTAPREVAARIGHADIVVTNKVRLDAAMLDAAPHMRMVAIAATGTDIVDLDACAARGIVVSNIRGYAARTVPEQRLTLRNREFAIHHRDGHTERYTLGSAREIRSVLERHFMLVLPAHPALDRRFAALSA